jgi:uncharacterized protein (TIGR00290 family)
MKKKEIVLFWSGGKDSALALWELQNNSEYSIKSLLTTIDENTNTVPFHGVDESLIKEQAKLIGIPLHRVYLPHNCSNQQYNTHLGRIFNLYKKKGITSFAFGDIFLQDIKDYREQQLKQFDCNALFPLWGKSITELQQIFFNNNFRSIITSISRDILPSKLLGKELTREIINTLPNHIDHFGGKGEFHTLVTFAPFFKFRLQTSMSTTITEGLYEVIQLRLP